MISFLEGELLGVDDDERIAIIYRSMRISVGVDENEREMFLPTIEMKSSYLSKFFSGSSPIENASRMPSKETWVTSRHINRVARVSEEEANGGQVKKSNDSTHKENR